MKIVRTATGNKKIEECAEPVALMKIREILTDHRNELINRLILDLPTYTNYKFNVKPDKDQLQSLTDKLYSIKHAPFDLDRYDTVVQEILANNTTYLNSELFYKDIDAMISRELRPNQMILMK